MMKIAFVNQRYGKEVNGGSEYYTKLMAEKLKNHYQVEVLTSKALTYDKWEDYYEEDTEDINGVLVRRFGVKRKRSRVLQKILKILITKCGCNTEKITGLWNKVLGPYVPDLVEYIRSHEEEYNAFIFVTYMYYPAVFGMREVMDKSIFVPTAHDEYCIYFKVYEKMFRMPKRIVFLTQEEKAFVQKQFHNESIPHDVIGVGIEVPEDANEEHFRRKYGISGDYFIYAGRVDPDKGCDEMFSYFIKLCEMRKELQLIVIGKAYMEIPKHEKIIYLGYVSEEDKYNAIKGAKLLWLPSKFESLSIALLEAMALGTPVLVNGACEVLKGHCVRSGGGMWYEGEEDVLLAIDRIEESKYKDRMIEYVEQNYNWKFIIHGWNKLICNLSSYI